MHSHIRTKLNYPNNTAVVFVNIQKICIYRPFFQSNELSQNLKKWANDDTFGLWGHSISATGENASTSQTPHTIYQLTVPLPSCWQRDFAKDTHFMCLYEDRVIQVHFQKMH